MNHACNSSEKVPCRGEIAIERRERVESSVRAPNIDGLAIE